MSSGLEWVEACADRPVSDVNIMLLLKSDMAAFPVSRPLWRPSDEYCENKNKRIRVGRGDHRNLRQEISTYSLIPFKAFFWVLMDMFTRFFSFGGIKVQEVSRGDDRPGRGP
jgi:hypothetical protein